MTHASCVGSLDRIGKGAIANVLLQCHEATYLREGNVLLRFLDDLRSSTSEIL